MIIVSNRGAEWLICARTQAHSYFARISKYSALGRGTRAQRSTNPVALCDGYGAVGTGIGQIQMAAETIRSARGEARTNDLDGEGRRMMSSGGGERDARGALPRRLHRARPVDLQITRSLTPALLPAQYAPAHWLLTGEVPGNQVLTVPLCPGKVPSKCRPIGVYPAPLRLDRQYRQDTR